MKHKNVALFGLFTALAMILSYVEALVPISVAVPGVKIGLANIVVMFALYKMGAKAAVSISLVRVVLVSILFGNLFSMVYSLAGAVLSLGAMLCAIRIKKLSSVGVGVIGGVFHNIGQIIVAIFVLETAGLIYYLPVLCISGTVAGILVGLLAGILVQRINLDKK